MNYRQLDKKKSTSSSIPDENVQLPKSIDHSSEQQSNPMAVSDFSVSISIVFPTGIGLLSDKRSFAAEPVHASSKPVRSRKRPNCHSAQPLPVTSTPPPSITLAA